MAFKPMFSAQCDKCKIFSISGWAFNERLFNRYAITKGWLAMDKWHVCPQCQTEHQNKQKEQL
jgi:predicted  nucleic acid-binding Zn ribbon protein